MPRTRQCSLRDHDWRLVRSGKREECVKCGTSFPCNHECSHLDCAAAREEMKDGGSMPAWVG